MADITMCTGEGCILKSNCYRFTAKPDACRQSYFVEAPIDTVSDTCRHFWNTKPEVLLS